MKNPLKKFRLLPAVIVVGAGLLAVKGAGLALDARAEDSQSTTAQQPAQTTAANFDPASDDSEAQSAAEVDVLGSLAKRRAELDAREQDLGMRENLIAATEKRVDGKIAELKDLQSQIQVLLGQRDDAEQKQITALVKTYSLMKPKDAARIFNTLDETVLMEVAPAMKPDVLGAILAQMQSDQAKTLTVKLANRLKPPAAAPAPQQLAALQPPASTDTPTTPADTQTQTATAPQVTPPVTPPVTPAVTQPPAVTAAPVKSDAKADAKTDAKAQVKADTKAETKTDAKADAKKPETKTAAKADTKAPAKVDAKSDVKTDVKADAKVDTKPQAKNETKPDAKIDAKSDAKPEPKAPGG